ncbi:hypothetical protein BVI1335_1270023 [Burkholderia vietnamiensis]|nr:hypothetical protein BVI1335_1270023 [Burkholderia vietnamiensis]
MRANIIVQKKQGSNNPDDNDSDAFQ